MAAVAGGFVDMSAVVGERPAVAAAVVAGGFVGVSAVVGERPAAVAAVVAGGFVDMPAVVGELAAVGSLRSLVAVAVRAGGVLVLFGLSPSGS